MKLWVTLLIAFVAVAGAFYYYDTSSATHDPYRSISVPPPPEFDFVPTSTEFRATQPEVETEPVATVVAGGICTGAESSNFFCYEQHYQNIVREEGINAAFTDLKERYTTNSYIVAQCHPLTHVIGREAALKFSTPGEAYKDGDGYCWSGYYHGVLETFLDKIGRENLPSEIDTVCDNIEGKESYSFDYYNCVHGLGHGVMAITDTELFQSLDYCKLLTGWWERQSCASGVYMENVIVDGLNHFTKYLDPQRPLYPCTESPEEFKNTCYLMQTSYILKVNGGDFADTYGWCEKAEENYRATCYQSLGRDASGRNTSLIEPTKNVCMLGKDYFQQSNCVIGAVKDIISYFHSDVEAKQFCAVLPSTDLQQLCTDTTVSYYAQF